MRSRPPCRLIVIPSTTTTTTTTTTRLTARCSLCSKGQCDAVPPGFGAPFSPSVSSRWLRSCHSAAPPPPPLGGNEPLLQPNIRAVSSDDISPRGGLQRWDCDIDAVPPAPQRQTSTIEHLHRKQGAPFAAPAVTLATLRTTMACPTLNCTYTLTSRTSCNIPL